LANDNAWTNEYGDWTITTIVPSDIGVREWQSWAIADATWWTATAGNQERAQFTDAAQGGLARGNVAIVDPDEWDDKEPPDPEAVQDYDTSLTSPAIDIRGVVADSITIQFDSSWRPEDLQAAEVSVSFDGGPSELLLTMTSVGTTTDFSVVYKGSQEIFDDLVNVNETIVLDGIPNPDGAETMNITWRMPVADNDWWWAIDNIVVTGDLNPTAVEAQGKLATVWGTLKRQ